MIGLVKKGNTEKEELTRSAVISTASSVSLLDCKAASEGASDGGVAASDSADVAGRSSEAVEVVRHLDVDDEVLLLLLRQTERSGDVVGDLQGGEGSYSVASLVHVAFEGTGAIGVDLVKGDSQHGARGYLGHTTSCQFVLGLLADVYVAVDLSSSAGIDNVLGDL